MPINFEHAPYIRQYRDEQGSFRALSVVTKAIAAYMRVLVDPLHGWLKLGGNSVAAAIRVHATGGTTRADSLVITRSVAQLLDEGYLVRCRLVGHELEAFMTHDDRDIELSNWIEDPEGDWVVIANWVPAQAGLNRQDARDWHALRRERIEAATESPQKAPPLHLCRTT